MRVEGSKQKSNIRMNQTGLEDERSPGSRCVPGSGTGITSGRMSTAEQTIKYALILHVVFVTNSSAQRVRT